MAGLSLTLVGRVTAQTFTTLHSFTASPNVTNSDGANPYGGVILAGDTLYGMANHGGSSGAGTAFAVNTNGGSFTNLHIFIYNLSSDGSEPNAGLILSGNTLYGTTYQGGIADAGTVFAVNTNGAGFTNLHSFTAVSGPLETNRDGAYPVGGLILSGNTLYGSAVFGGTSGFGALFRVNVDGTSFTNIYSFTGSNDGAYPQAGLILSGSTLYGTAMNGGSEEGSSGAGTVFAVNTDGTGFTNLHGFTGGSDGSQPYAGLILSGNTLYGTTTFGGNSGNGTVFKVATNGTGFTNLYSFTALSVPGSTNTDGARPYGRLILAGGILYGTAQDGGRSAKGVVFKVNTDGTGFTNLYSFTATSGSFETNSDGANPQAGLILSANTLYGTAKAGGVSGNGTVFSLSLPTVPAATRTWSGLGADTFWSNAANWSNGVPVDGDSVLLLRHPQGFVQNAVNDLTNLTLVSVRCEALGYNLSGGNLRLTGEVLLGGPAAGANMTITAPLEIPGPTLQIISTNSGGLTLSGVVNASTGSVVTIEGGISFGASPTSDYRAQTRLRSGFMALLSTRISGPLVVGGTTNSASVILQSGTLFGSFPPLTILTNGSVFNISTLNSVGPLTLDGGTLRLGNRSPNGEITVNGNALLGGGGSLVVSAINSFGTGTLTVTGTVSIAGCSLTIQSGTATITKPTVIVGNDGVDPINGTFIGLPEGSVLTNDLMRYTLSYVGGDGNDVTLAPIIVPPHIDSILYQTNGLKQLTVQGQPGFSYVIEATTNLPPPPTVIPWQPIGTNGTLANGQLQFSDPDTTLFTKRFYRVVKP
jgi:uncharacterized repeat protein (TIGR03803 family)